MAQDTLYFPHDYDPFDDIKFEGMVAKHGAVGYSVFWRLVEMLHSSADHNLLLDGYVYDSISGRLSIPSEQVEMVIDDCIHKYHLFQATNGLLWSNRVLKNIEKRKQISEQRSLAGKASAEQRRKDRRIANPEQPLNNR